MKVIIIGPAHPFRGGIADTNHSLARAFNDLGHDTELITFTLQYPNFIFPGKNQFSESAAPEGLEISRKISSINPISWVRTARYIKKQRPDLVIIRYWLPYMAPALGSIAKFIKGKIKVVAMCDNVLPHEHRTGDRMFTKYFAKHIDGFVTLSEHVKNELKEFTEKPIVSLFHPINTDLPERISKEKARSILGLEQQGSYVLFFGLVRKYKGLDFLIESLSDKRLTDLNVKLIIAGEFYEEKTVYLDLIKNLNLENRTIIHDHFIPTADLSAYFSGADILAQTYRSASQSGVSQMGYHFHTPLLVSNVGGLTEMVKHNHVGLISELSAEKIADQLVDFFSENKGPLFSKNLSFEKEKYSWKTFSQTILSSFC